MTLQQVKQKLYTPIDNSFLVVFRVAFGLIMLWDIYRYWHAGWIKEFYIDPPFLFKYYGFEWIQPWPGDGMYTHFIVLGVAALFIAAGFLYRISIVVFFLGFSYVFLLDQARYLNHFYLVILFNFLFIFLPAHKSFSIDSIIWKNNKTDKAPLWNLWILRFQMEVLLIYAGIVKINSDWLQLEPLRMWLGYRDDMPVVGWLYTQDWAIAIAAYGVIMLHIVGAPLLLWKRTRLTVFIIYACFHALNHFTFSIGIFPWLTLFATLVFFEPHWPKQVKAAIYHFLKLKDKPDVPDISPPIVSENNYFSIKPWNTNLVLSFCFLWGLFQVLMPLRHLLYPGNVSWTEEGHRFAWQMKLRDKEGFADFQITSRETNQSWYVSPEPYLTRKQARKMPTQPDMILQFAYYLEKLWKEKYNLKDVEIRVNNYVSLNGREPAPMVNPSIDLTTLERNLKKNDWILPLHEPLIREESKE